jgi:DNA-binding MarR family transcriptional regulator
MKQQAAELMSVLTKLMETAVNSGKHPFPEVPLSPQEVRILLFLGDKGEMIMTELAAAMDTPLSTLTRTADRLEQKGLIVRSRSDRDRRIVVITASEKGKLLYDGVRKSQLAMAVKMLEALQPEERGEFLKLVSKIALSVKE